MSSHIAEVLRAVPGAWKLPYESELLLSLFSSSHLPSSPVIAVSLTLRFPVSNTEKSKGMGRQGLLTFLPEFKVFLATLEGFRICHSEQNLPPGSVILVVHTSRQEYR